MLGKGMGLMNTKASIASLAWVAATAPTPTLEPSLFDLGEGL